MHGLMNRSLQSFVEDVYGSARWMRVAEVARLDFTSFEAMLDYDDSVTLTVIDAATRVLRKPRADLLEDLGIYLVSHPNMARIRRLLRFGGAGFVDFLDSLDDLPDRVRLAVPDLVIPTLELAELEPDRYRLRCGATPEGMVHVILGVLRALADDYGALVFLDLADGPVDGAWTIEIAVLSTSFAEGRSFELASVI
ncbi:heme-NO-binding protein [Palleronia aestuarii]|uniref:Heme-NO-binding protein n=1 Tax=Palleronia aestuarii TaxID=568105 RepID=A0A2W7NSR8_9RHOB|nr:heme NO-binding domain-containing protein [Palleronia aestuarii]PZX16336.1 heme-NO-binding protein [Palleronia aestuarii]